MFHLEARKEPQRIVLDTKFVFCSVLCTQWQLRVEVSLRREHFSDKVVGNICMQVSSSSNGKAVPVL
jgi:hypothetical protein